MGKPLKITATAAFVRKCNEIDDMLGKLRTMSADHYGTDPDGLNWGHVGSLERIADLLRQAMMAGVILTDTAKRENTPV